MSGEERGTSEYVARRPPKDQGEGPQEEKACVEAKGEMGAHRPPRYVIRPQGSKTEVKERDIVGGSPREWPGLVHVAVQWLEEERLNKTLLLETTSTNFKQVKGGGREKEAANHINNPRQ